MTNPTWRELLERAQQWFDRPGREPVPVTHEDGCAWNERPAPWRWHFCWSQSWGSCGPFQLVDRCPCGAIRIDGGPWLHKNSRRHSQGGIGPRSGGENVGDDGLGLIQELRQALREGDDDR